MTEQEWLTSTERQGMLAWLEDNDDALGPRSVSDRKLRLFTCACCRQVWQLLADDAPCRRCDGRGRRMESDDSWPERRPCKSCRGTGRLNRSRRAVEVVERYADGEATESQLQDAFADSFRALQARPGDVLAAAAHALTYEPSLLYRVPLQIQAGLPNPAGSGRVQAALLREVVGNPWQPMPSPWVNVPYKGGISRQVTVPWLLDSTPFFLAQAAYLERLPDGTLDPERLAVLADALEEAGCTDHALLRHLRGEERILVCKRCGKADTVNCNCDVPAWIPLRGPHVRGCWAVDLILGKE